jgi:excisionase family DNA binding protein
VPDELVEAVAHRAAELLAGRLPPDPWLDVAGAAEYLACPPSRIYALVSACRIPVHRDGSRLLFRRSELDLWVERGGAKRP